MCDVLIKNTNPNKKDSKCIFKNVAIATSIEPNKDGDHETLLLCSLHADIYTNRHRHIWAVKLDAIKSVG